MIDLSERNTVTGHDAEKLVIRCLLRGGGGPSLPSVISLLNSYQVVQRCLNGLQRPANPLQQ